MEVGTYRGPRLALILCLSIELSESMLRTLPLAAAVLAVLLVTMGCRPDGEAPVNQFSTPASAQSGQPHLYAGDDGRVWMSWVERGAENQQALRYATTRDTGWSEPQTAARGTDWFVNWADVPSLRPLPEGRLAAHFLESNGPSTLAYGVRITQTTNGTWQSPVSPHDDATETEHGFASLLPWANHRLLAVWLDGRNMTGQTGHAGEMTLRGAVLDSNGTVEQRARIDARTCECCPTAAVRTGDDALVAYRDRSADEVRNIQLVRFDGQSWTEPTLLHDDGWTINGCPVNGPALAAAGDRVAAAWYTAPGGTPQVKVAFSDNGGRRFTDPVGVAEGTPKGRVDVVLLEKGGAAVSWLDRSTDAATLRVQAVRPTGDTGRPVTIATFGAVSRGVGMPRLVRSGSTLYAAWTNPEGDGVRTALVRSAALR
jgi:hypothetical protein